MKKAARGRPVLEFDKATRASVALLAGFGVPEARIAAQIKPTDDGGQEKTGISQNSLRKHFKKELMNGALMLEREAIATYVDLMRRGTAQVRERIARTLLNTRFHHGLHEHAGTNADAPPVFVAPGLGTALAADPNAPMDDVEATKAFAELLRQGGFKL